MKTKIQFQASAAIAILLASLTLASFAQPATPPAAPPLPSASAIDPTTGLPIGAPSVEPVWINPNWADPNLILTNVEFDGLPLSVVAAQLRDRFQAENTFDILPMPHTYGRDWGNEIMIDLQLHNVRASEVFNAMNLVFENDHTPVRWQLQANGSRELVQLRVLPDAAPVPTAGSQAQEKQRMVYFVGNLIGDPKSGGMTMQQVCDTINGLWPADFGNTNGAIQYHEDAQLLVINGTPKQLEFVHQILAALEQKVQAARPKSSDDKDLKELENLIKTLQNGGANTQ